MRRRHSRSSYGLASLAPLTLVFVLSACESDSNPVVPSSLGEPGSVSTSARVDGGGARDTASAGEDAASETVTLSDAELLPCDLLAQPACAAMLGPAFGCYPLGGVGRCQLGGAIGTLGPCLVDTDCAPGLLCEVLSGQGTFGLCQPICPLSDLTSALCAAGGICRPLAGFLGTNVGRCSSS
jgi:hypothetical protein